MSRHRNLRWQMNEDDDYYDNEDDNQYQDDEDDLYNQEVKDELITVIMEATGVNIATAENALEEFEWDTDAAISAIKQRKRQQALERRQKKEQPKKSPINKVELVEPVKQVVVQRTNDTYPIIQHEIPEDEALTINLVVIGHVDSGKSTIMGHLLYNLGYVDQKTMHRYERDSKQIGKESFQYAWVLDSGDEERQRGVTIDVGFNTFRTQNRKVVLLDAPGHLDYVPKMISGAAQADAAVLVIDSQDFERTFNGGQSKEHAFIARAMGITSMIIAVNKMETNDWNQNRFEMIQANVEAYLCSIGYRRDNLKFVPISGLQGTNLDQKSELAQWYQGYCLVDLIDQLVPGNRNVNLPFRLSIMDVYKQAHGIISGFCVGGKVEGGVIKLQDKVVIMPSGLVAFVNKIECMGENVQFARAGDNVDISLKQLDQDFETVVPGSVLCDINYPIPMVTKFQIKAVLFDIQFPVLKGSQFLMHFQSLRIPVNVSRIISQNDPQTWEVVKRNPRMLTKFMSATLEITASNPVCLELYSNYKGLGRLTLRDEGTTVLAGMVISF